MRTVRDVLASKNKPFNFITSAATVFDALQMLNTVNLSYLVVMDGEEFKGIFSERDYTRNVILKGRASKDTLVKDVMTTDLPVVELGDSVEYCMNLMNTRGARYLLVFDGERFQGVVTIHDLLRQVIANKEEVFDQTLTHKLLDNDEGGFIY